MAMRATEFLQVLLDDFEAYLNLYWNRPRPETLKSAEASQPYFDDLERRDRDLKKRVALATRLIQAAGYDARSLIFSANRDLATATKSLLLVAIGAYEYGAVEIPEPPAPERPKDQKFQVLDAPNLLTDDLPLAPGVLGCAVIYLDIDHFKAMNTRFTERVVDQTILPQFQRLLLGVAAGHGLVYAEGGDEVVVLLPNFSLTMATAFATDLLTAVQSAAFVAGTETVSLTISAGVAATVAADDVLALPNRANEAKRHAKEMGRNRASVWAPEGCRPA